MVPKNALTKIVRLFDAVHIPTWLIIILALTLVLRIPSFFEPYSYGDETIYLTLGEGIRQGKVLYRDVHDNKPPLLYVLAAVAGNLFWFKAILAFWSLITIVLFWKLAEFLFPGRTRIHQAGTFIFALLTTLPLLEGNIANAENFMIGFSLFAFLILLSRASTAKNLVISGVLFSIATLFKVPAAFEAPVIVFYWLVTGGFGFKNIKEVARKTIFLLLGFSLPIIITFVWYTLRGAFHDYLIAGFLQNFGYLSTFRPDDAQKSFLVKNGPLLLRGGLTLFGTLALFPFRKKLSKEYIFLTIWLFFTLFAVTLSERPYPHYLLQSTAPAAMMFAILFAMPSIEQAIVIIPLAVMLVVPVYYKFWYYSTSAYYTRFLNFAVGKTSKEEYLTQFGGHVPMSYKTAEFLLNTTQKGDKVFVWGPENQTVYALARRFPPIKYVAQYHINDFTTPEEVLKKIESDSPKAIVFLPGSPEFPGLTELVNKNYILVNTSLGASTFFKSSKYLQE